MQKFKDGSMQKYTPYIVFSILVALAFFTGRCSKGRSYDQREVDALKRDIVEMESSRDNHKASAQLLRGQAIIDRVEILKIEKQYKDVLAVNAKLTKAQKDVKAKLALKVSGNDSSWFTEPVVEVVLEMDADKDRLEKESRIDSLMIEKLGNAYAELDSAYIKCDKIVGKKDEVITTLKRKNKKPHWWELPAVGLALVVGLYLGGN